jgi:hypothetical protein
MTLKVYIYRDITSACVKLEVGLTIMDRIKRV